MSTIHVNTIGADTGTTVSLDTSDTLTTANGTLVMAANTIVASYIAADAVTTAKIADDGVTGAKIADDTIVEANIANDAVGSAELKTLSTLLIKDSGGSTLKTIHGAGA